MFVCLDDSSTVCAPKELGVVGSRYRVMDQGYEYERRISLVQDCCNRRLALAGKNDDWDQCRESLTFSIGSGLSYIDGEDVTMATNGDVIVVFKGDLHVPVVHSEDEAQAAFERGDDMMKWTNPSNAQRMLDFYTWSDGMRMNANGKGAPLHTDFAVDKLSQLPGKYAFVLYDKKRHRLVVVRDAVGAQELYWGVASDGDNGNTMLFSTEQNEALSECSPTATMFPKGTMLVCEGSVAWRSEVTGLSAGPAKPGTTRLLSFTRPEKPVRAVPRINSSGMLCGAVFRVESASDLGGMMYSDMIRPPSCTDIAAM